MRKNSILRILCLLLSLVMMTCLFSSCKDEEIEEKPSTTNEISIETTTGDVVTEENSTVTQGGNNETTVVATTSTGTTTGTQVQKDTTVVKTTATAEVTTTSAKATTAKTTAAKKSTSYYAPQVLSNTTGSIKETLSDGTIIDYSNKDSGYVMIKYSGTHSNVRVQVTTPSGSTPLYPIFSTGWETIPLTNGGGTYTITVLHNDGGNSYTVAGKVSVSASGSSSVFLRPNLFCNYTSGTACVSYAAELTRGCDTEFAKIEAIYNYVVGTFKYDHGKASSVASAAYVPNLSNVWSSKSGICFDYASTMAAMLRTQGLPTKVCVGYVNGNTYHAWISVYVKGSGWVNGIIQFNGNSWKLMDPTFASTGGNNNDWSTKGSYQDKYYY